ncbi:MAG: carbohydrate kinase family protein [Candidatus Nanoarchaeia archaeon]
MKFDVVCFGSGLVDLFAYTDAREIHGKISYPVGSKLQIEKLASEIGGGGINTATTFSRMGLNTGLIAKIGDSLFGKKILEKIKKEKIRFLGKVQGEAGTSIVLDSIEHERTILTYKGSNDLLKFNELKCDFDTKLLYFSSLIKESFKTQTKLAEKFKKIGAKLAYNPSLYIFKKENVLPLIKLVDILILNKEEADMINKKHNQILNLGPEIVIVTDGKNPFYCYSKEKTYKIYPNEKVKAIERTGAGDAFASGFVAGLIKTKDIETSLKIGVANSESVIRYIGSTNVILNYKQALNYIKKNPCKVEVF